LFRRHVSRRAVAYFRARQLIRNRRQTEIHNHHLAALVHHDVLRLQVAMNHAPVMRRLQARAQLPRRHQRFVFRQPADPLQQPRQVFAIHIFHRKERHPFDFADIVYPADIGVRHLARHAHFAMEPFEQSLIPASFRRQELERHRLPQHQVRGAVNFAHPAASQQADDAVSPAQQCAGNEPSFVVSRGRGDMRNRFRGSRRNRRHRGFERSFHRRRVHLAIHIKRF